MTSRRRGVGLTPMETRRDVIVRAAVLADELGYETFAVPEGWGLDSTPVLTEIALRTARIQVASAVLSVWGRTPATLAMTAATRLRPRNHPALVADRGPRRQDDSRHPAADVAAVADAGGAVEAGRDGQHVHRGRPGRS